MNETKYINTEIDRTGWGPGPWDAEPDKISWTDELTGMPCLAVRANPWQGSWCGYVAVPPGHPYHGKDYDEVPVAVHGGLTFSEGCNEDGPIERAVCHIPEPGQPADVWWLGFDCGHCMDIMPAYRTYLPEMWDLYERTGAQYRTLTYVRGECARLALRLWEAAR